MNEFIDKSIGSFRPFRIDLNPVLPKDSEGVPTERLRPVTKLQDPRKQRFIENKTI